MLVTHRVGSNTTGIALDVNRVITTGVTSITTWSESFAAFALTVRSYARGKLTISAPKSRFPELVYTWSNWLFACHDCNQAKGGRWPTEGYVDPCATSKQSHPESYFEFDVLTAEVLPREGLSQSRRNRAQKTITDLRLNGRHHLRKRLAWLLLLSDSLTSDATAETPDKKSLRDHLASRGTQLSSITRAWLSQRGFSIDNRSKLQNS